MRVVPTMILVGSTARNLGKTALATRPIEALRPREKVVGVKVTTIRDRGAKCPRGGDGCGACSSLNGNTRSGKRRIPAEKRIRPSFSRRERSASSGSG